MFKFKIMFYKLYAQCTYLYFFIDIENNYQK